MVDTGGMKSQAIDLISRLEYNRHIDADRVLDTVKRLLETIYELEEIVRRQSLVRENLMNEIIGLEDDNSWMRGIVDREIIGLEDDNSWMRGIVDREIIGSGAKGGNVELSSHAQYNPPRTTVTPTPSTLPKDPIPHNHPPRQHILYQNTSSVDNLMHSSEGGGQAGREESAPSIPLSPI